MVPITCLPVNHTLSERSLCFYLPRHYSTYPHQTKMADVKPLHPEIVYAERSSASDPEKVGHPL